MKNSEIAALRVMDIAARHGHTLSETAFSALRVSLDLLESGRLKPDLHTAERLKGTIDALFIGLNEEGES